MSERRRRLRGEGGTAGGPGASLHPAPTSGWLCTSGDAAKVPSDVAGGLPLWEPDHAASPTAHARHLTTTVARAPGGPRRMDLVSLTVDPATLKTKRTAADAARRPLAAPKRRWSAACDDEPGPGMGSGDSSQLGLTWYW